MVSLSSLFVDTRPSSSKLTSFFPPFLFRLQPPNADIKANVFWTVVKSARIIGSYVGNREDAIE